MPYVVTRQNQFPDGDLVVEVSSGGIDYVNPGAYCAKYRGEWEEIADPREAVNTAWRIAAEWQRDKPEDVILIGMGCTGGMTMPFDGMPLLFANYLAMKKQARLAWEKLPKCDNCGELLGKERYGSWEYGEYNCCSEYCAERYYHLDLDDEELIEDELIEA